MYSAAEPASFCRSFRNGKFELSSNSLTLVLKIKNVDSSNSGLYFCGFWTSGGAVIVNASYLQVQGNVSTGDQREQREAHTDLMSVVLTAVTIVLTKVTLVLVVIGMLFPPGSGSQTVEVQPGEEASLQCSTSGSASLEFWIRLINRTHVHCVSVLAGGSDDPKYCEGIDSDRFKMSRKSSTLFLTIKNVDSSDSGQYICGFYTSGYLHFTVISLQVKVKSQFKVSLVITDKSDETAKLLSGVLGGLTVVLVLLIIGLVVKIRKLQTGFNLPVSDCDSTAPVKKCSTSLHRKQPHCSKVECGAVRASVTLVMNKLTFITVFSLCSYSSGSQTVEVQPGEEASLQCTSMIVSPSLEFWIRQINRTDVHCVSFLTGDSADPKYCEGIDSGKFKMSKKSSTLFLTIKDVDSSDSGQYICGFFTNGNLHSSVISVQVKDKSDETAKLLSGVLGGLTVVLVLLIIGLVVKIRKLQTANKEEPRPQPAEDSQNVTYAAVEIRPKGRRRAPEPNVIYAQTR
ncbi:uncharacterized protein V6R79_022934 [Siganus canaliculatus]